MEPLRHLDFDLGRAGEVFGGDAEAPGGDLLDAGILGVAVVQRGEARAVLATLAGIRLAADAVHGDGEGLVRLGRERAERHAGRGEAAADFLDGLDFLDRDGRALLEPQALAQRDRRGLLHRGDILLVVLPLGGLVHALDADVSVEALQRGRRPGVDLAVATEAVDALVEDLRLRAEGARVAGQRLLRDFLEAEAHDLRDSAGEGEGDDVGVQADGAEDLRAAVAGERGDAHLGHDLEQALFQRGAIVLRDRRGLERLFAGLHLAAGNEAVERGERGVRIDRGGAVAEQAGELVDVAALGGLANQAGMRALVDPHEVMMHRAGGQEHRDGRMLGVDVPIAENDQRRALVDGLLSLGADAVEMGLETLRPFGDRETAAHRGGMEGTILEREDLLDFGVGEHRGLQAQELRVRGRLIEPVAVLAGEDLDGHDELLADRVDRRVSHLREELLEIGVKQARLAREHGQRRIVAHRADGFLAGLAHDLEDRRRDRELLLGVAGGELLLDQGRAGRGLGVEG